MELNQMDEPTKAMADKIYRIIVEGGHGLDDYGVIDALAHVIVKFAR